ncbi:MAG: hypothetical protein CME19_11215 [Gemmatimonadetes bacterium]|nr:hypothetical protein [Gemmatimonadota bacterium]
MKITDIKATPSLCPENRNWSLLRIDTDEGIPGFGEWVGAPVSELRNQLVGKDPRNVNEIHHDTLWRMQGRGAGVETALWDLKGKAVGEPMHRVLGGKLHDCIRMYCDCHAGAFWT